MLRITRYAILIVSGLLVLAVGLSFTPGPAPAHAQPPAAAGNIAFVSERDGNFELYVMQADGSGLRRLTNAPLTDGDAAWSPDGTRLAYVTTTTQGQSELALVDIDSGQITMLTTLGAKVAAPAWSPDGMQIAFVARLGDAYDIFTVSADGSDLVNITRSQSLNGNPAWSPDGTRIAFDSDQGGSPDIYVTTVATGDITRLTDTPGTDRAPAWSPDGARLAFVSDRDESADLYVINADGSGLIQTTSIPGDEHPPVWAADSMALAFSSEIQPGVSEIFTVHADGTELRQLTTGGREATAPTWSPDGMWIAYASNEGGTFDIYVMEIASGIIYNLTNNVIAGDHTPLWAAHSAILTAAQPTLPPPPSATPQQLAPPPTATLAAPTLPPTPTPQQALPTVPPTPTLPPPTPLPSPTVITNPDILLVYNPAVPSFELINTSGRTLDLSPLAFENSGNRVDAGIWVAANMSSDIENFAVGGCLGLWGLGVPQQALPPECNYRHGWWESDNVVFWTGSTFTVYYAGRTIAVCETTAGRCPILLANTVSPAQQTAQQAPVPTAGPDAELLLVYNSAVPSFDLINIAGRPVNVAPISFQGNGQTVGTDIWLASGAMSGEMDNFPIDGCLGLWGLGAQVQPTPPECRLRHSWWGSDDVVFWAGGTFTVLYGGSTLATCDTAAGRCLVDLPG